MERKENNVKLFILSVLKSDTNRKYRMLYVTIIFPKLLNCYLIILNMNKHGQRKNIYPNLFPPNFNRQHKCRM